MAQTNYIEDLIQEGGEIMLGALPPHECAAAAADGSNCLAMLVRRDGEGLNALLKRLDKAIGLAWSNHMFIHEVNEGERPAVVPSQFHRQEGLEATLTAHGVIVGAFPVGLGALVVRRQRPCGDSLKVLECRLHA
jgi:hypothetical protein